MKRLWIAIVTLFGWNFDLPSEEERKVLHHCVLIEAPHTSIYDFLLGGACVWKLKLNARFFIKKEFFVFPLRHFLRWSGALPVDRGNKNNHMVESAVKALAENDFKRGFYEIATQAGVPIALTYVDYKTRHMGIGPVITPSGDFKSDMRRILDFYSGVSPRNASGWNIQLLKSTYSSDN